VHGFVVASLVGIIVLPALKQIGGVTGPALVVAAAILGAAVAVGYMRFRPLRMFLTVLSPALLLFPGLFLFNSPVFKVISEGEDAKAVYAEVDATAPVIFVVFDELEVMSLMDEHRQIDAIRYPNFAALAQDATWFRNATTVGENTVYAIPAILAGNYPDAALLPTAADHPHNLFTLLGGSYDLKVAGTITQLCPARFCRRSRESLARRMNSLLSDVSIVYLHILLPQDLRARLPSITQNWMDFLANAAQVKDERSRLLAQKRLFWFLMEHLKKDRSQVFMEFVNAIDSTEGPTLYFLHILLPHPPYIYLPSGRRYRTDIGLAGLVAEKWSADESAVIQGYQRHLLQVGFVDTLLGKLLARLKAVNLYDRSLIVITSDHGASFRPNDFKRFPKAAYKNEFPGHYAGAALY
jgi:hypothetical protein